MNQCSSFAMSETFFKENIFLEGLKEPKNIVRSFQALENREKGVESFHMQKQSAYILCLVRQNSRFQFDY